MYHQPESSRKHRVVFPVSWSVISWGPPVLSFSKTCQSLVRITFYEKVEKEASNKANQSPLGLPSHRTIVIWWTQESSVLFCSMCMQYGFAFPVPSTFCAFFSFNLYKKSNVSTIDMPILQMRKISLVLMICLCSWFQIQMQTHLPAENELLGTNLPTLGQAPKGKLDFMVCVCLFASVLLLNVALIHE